jgi:hypothetical protein
MMELLTKYPKAAKVVREHFLEKLLEGLKTEGLPEDFKEHVREQGITDEKVAKLIDNHPRMLMDIFDENEVYINVFPTNEYENIEFRTQVNFEDVGTSKFSRKEAEFLAVKKAFELLEVKL